MPKLLVNAPTGRQEVIDIQESGSYFKKSRVIWDERKDGPLPEITLGGMKRSGKKLVLDNALLASAPEPEAPRKSPFHQLLDILQTNGGITEDQANTIKS